ncbi:MAG: hypothetical protein AMXMBFR46_11740 [Acidimicrobiia bacterium]
MLTVPEAAARTGRNPETIRRWIRSGRLPAHKVGTQHVIDPADLDAVAGPCGGIPPGWQHTLTGEAMPDWGALMRDDRATH